MLENDRKLYGVDDAYEIKDNVPDELQRRVDDVIGGISIDG